MNYLPESARLLVKQAESLFSKRSTLMLLWQELAENFYPERADFTVQRNMGDNWADYLSDSYPLLIRRELGNALGSMLRPKSTPWMKMIVRGYDSLRQPDKQFLEWATEQTREHMYFERSKFERATKGADHDFATFGQCVLDVDYLSDRSGLLFRTHHLSQVVWVEDDDLEPNTIFRKYKSSAIDLIQRFGKENVHQEVRLILEKDPYREVNCMHMMVPAARYPELPHRHKYTSLHIDMDHKHVHEAVPSRRRRYVIPRWQLVSGSQYAYSPASITALPDTRLIQAMTLTLLDAGERYANPPLVATEEVVRSDIQAYPGGVTWVDSEYDERLGDALRPMTTNPSGYPLGLDMSDRVKMQVRSAFFLDKLSMPSSDKERTAFEVSQMVQEYIRNAMPVFSPMETEYNGQMCNEVFEALLWEGAYGPLDEIPESVFGQQVEFEFKSPLHEGEGQARGAKFLEASQLLGTTLQIDPTARFHVDIHKAFREAIEGIDVPADWVVDEQDAMERVSQAEEAMAMQQAVQMGAEAAQMAETAGAASETIQRAEQMSAPTP